MADELNKKPDEEVVESSDTSTTNPEVADFVAGKKAPAPSTTPTTGNEQQVTTPDSGQPAVDINGTDIGPNPFADRAAVQDAVAQQTSTPATTQLPVVTPEEQPQDTNTPQYMTDWSKVDNIYEFAAKHPEIPLQNILQDYWRWGYDTGNPTQWLDGKLMEYDLSKSVADNEAEKKRQANKERWDKVSNFLLHLGNAIGNVGGGGYASMKLEDPVQWGERQRMLRDKALEQRRLNNQSIVQQMHKNFTDARAQKVQQQNFEMKQRELNLKENSQKHKEYMDEYRIKVAQQKFDYQKEKDRLDRELKERQISQKDYQLKIAALNATVNEYRAHNPVKTTVEKTDSRGRKTKEERVQTRGNSDEGSNNAPPSRRNNSNTNNTPPSRRKQ